MDDRPQKLVSAFYTSRKACVWCAAQTLSYATPARGGTPAEVITTMVGTAKNTGFEVASFILHGLAQACVNHQVTWKDVGVGGNV